MLDTEFGGMNEVLANLYQLTGDADHLTTAQHFDHAEIFDPLAAQPGPAQRATTPTPRSRRSSARSASTTPPAPPATATSPTNFWDIVIGRHTYAIGGNSNGEYFQAPERASPASCPTPPARAATPTTCSS